MSKISQNVLDKIKEDDLKPKPKWVFVLWNVMLIASFISAILVGALVTGLVILKLSHLEWGFMRIIGDGVLPGYWEVLPIMWLGLLVLVVILASQVFEMMEGNYKYSHWIVLGGAVVSSILLGGVVYASRLADVLENSLRANLNVYEQMETLAEQKWNLPEKGLLPGKIIEIRESDFDLEDLKDNEWIVTADLEMIKRARLQPNQMIMVIGEKTADGEFLARDIKEKRAMGGNKPMKKMIIQRIKKLPTPPLKRDEQGRLEEIRSPKVELKQELEVIQP